MDLREREKREIDLCFNGQTSNQGEGGPTLSLGWSLVILSTIIVVVRVIFIRPLPLWWNVNLPTGITVVIIFLLFINIFLLAVLHRFKITGIFLILGTAYWPDKVVSSQIPL
jgi:hypothetical protein